MAVTASKTWVAGEVLTASDLNGEFLNVYGNGETLGWPATVSKNFAGNTLTLDADGDTTLTADTDDRIDLALSGVDLFRFDGTVTSPVNGYDFIASATGVMPNVTVISTADTNVDFNIIPLGTGNITQAGTRVLLLGDESTAQSILAGQIFG